MECDILIYSNNNLIGRLGSGVTSVINLCNHVDSGDVKNILTINRSFGCNIDFTIAGSDLIEFIKNYYDRWTVDMLCNDLNINDIYEVICIDLS